MDSSTTYCCNSCGHLPDFGENRAYFMTSCGHILCDKCRRIGGSSCLTCQKKCRCAEITTLANLKPEIKDYFSVPLDVITQASTKAIKITEFQSSQWKCYKNQTRKFIAQLQGQLDSLAHDKTTLKGNLDSIIQENTGLRQRLEALEQRDQSWIGNGAIARQGGDNSVGDAFFNDSPHTEPMIVDPPMPREPEPSPFFGPRNPPSQPLRPRPLGLNANHNGNGTVTVPASQVSGTAYISSSSRLTRQYAPGLPNFQSQRRQTATNNTNVTSRFFRTPPSTSSGSSHTSQRSNASTPFSMASSRFGSVSSRSSNASSGTSQANAMLAQLRMSFHNRASSNR